MRGRKEGGNGEEGVRGRKGSGGRKGAERGRRAMERKGGQCGFGSVLTLLTARA